MRLAEDKNKIEAELKSRLNPKYYFSASQKKFRKNRKSLQESIKLLDLSKIEKTSVITDNDKIIFEVKSQISHYNSINIFEVKDKLYRINSDLLKINNSLDDIQRKKEKINIELEPIVDKLYELDQKIEECCDIINEAQYYQNQLSIDSNNSYDRAMIHQECLKKLNSSSPIEIIKWEKRQIRKLTNERQKFLYRAERIFSESGEVTSFNAKITTPYQR